MPMALHDVRRLTGRESDTAGGPHLTIHK
jgi:hypothetical protein